MNEEKTQIADGAASELNAELGFLVKTLFCIFLFASTTTYAGSGSKPRECVYIETGLKVKEERRGDGQIDDCLTSNKIAYDEAITRCRNDFYCFDLYTKEEARRMETSNHLDVFFVLCLLMFGLGYSVGSRALCKSLV